MSQNNDEPFEKSVKSETLNKCDIFGTVSATKIASVFRNVWEGNIKNSDTLPTLDFNGRIVLVILHLLLLVSTFPLATPKKEDTATYGIRRSMEILP